MTATFPPTASITAFDFITSMRLHFFVGISNFRQHIYVANVNAFYFALFAVFQAHRYSVYILGGIHMSTLAERVREALTESGLTIAELARRTGVKHATVSFWLSGKTKTMSASNANAAAQALGVSVRWLVDGFGEKRPQNVLVFNREDDTPEDFISVPLFQINFAAGESAGEPTYEEMTECEPRYFSRAFIRSRHVSEHNLKCFKVHGDSMEPVLWDGDVILVDCSYQPILDGRVYTFIYAGDLRVKRLFKRMDGSILIRSDNPDKAAFPDELVTGDNLNRLRLIGRVIDRSGDGGL